MKSEYSLVIVGAGPAGMAAALTAAAQGIDVAVFDEQMQPGGQIYRNVDSSPLPDAGLPGRDYESGKPLLQEFRQAPIDYFPGTSVWYLDNRRRLGVLQQGVSRTVDAEVVVLACGAQERPMPIPGWQLPGVITAGAGQILLKSAALVPAEPPLLAGSGPLMLLLAWQYLQAGIGLRGIIDTTPRRNRLPALARLPWAMAGADYLLKGFGLVRAIRRAGVPWFREASNLRAAGDERLRSVSFESDAGVIEIDARILMLHQGIIPALQVADAAGCSIEWNETQQCWQVGVDIWGESSVEGIFIAGDGAGIGGARVAELSGRLAALQIAARRGDIDKRDRDRLARPIFKTRRRHLAIRPLLDSYYRVDDSLRLADADTLVCRCEEVDLAQIEAVAEFGCNGPNQVKAFTRCGMGSCQGRFCGDSLETLLARCQNRDRAAIGRFTPRPPLKPITLGQLATGYTSES